MIGYALRGEHSEDRVRPGRPDGRQHLRGLRRMRAGLPDRRADAQDARSARRRSTRKVDSVCPFCGVGCQLTYNVKDDKIVSVDGRDGPANHGRLCVKGRFGFDYAHHPQRLTKPLIRKPGVPKDFDDAPRPARLAATCSAKRPGTRRSRFAAGKLKRAARHARPEGAGRLRLGQGQQRRGLPVPEAGAHRLRQQQRRPLHAPVPRLERGGAARRRRLGRGQQPGQRRRACRADLRDRLQPDRATIRWPRPG